MSGTAFVSRTQTAAALRGLNPDLAAAISQAAAEYNVPAPLLVGIWADESGSSYPNPAVNSEGYGGLFGLSSGSLGGTSPAAASTQAQADAAAQVLARGFQQADGSVAGALSYYTTGQTSPVDQSYVSAVTGRAGVSPTSSAPFAGMSGLSSSTALSNPAGNASHGTPQEGSGSFWSGVFGEAESVGGDVLQTAEGAAQGVWGGMQSAEELITAPLAFLKAALWLIHPLSWLRAVEAVAGIGLVIGGILVATGAAGKITQAAAQAAPALE